MNTRTALAKNEKAKHKRIKAIVEKRHAEFKQSVDKYINTEDRYVKNSTSVIQEYLEKLKSQLSKEILQMNVNDFLTLPEEVREETLGLDATFNVANASPLAQSNTRESDAIDVVNQQESVVSPNKADPLPQALAVLVETPYGNRKMVVPRVPRIIAPRMKHNSAVVAGRILAPDEIGFSVNGSPLVCSVQREEDKITDAIGQALAQPIEQLTPLSKDLATALRKKLFKEK